MENVPPIEKDNSQETQTLSEDTFLQIIKKSQERLSAIGILTHSYKEPEKKLQEIASKIAEIERAIRQALSEVLSLNDVVLSEDAVDAVVNMSLQRKPLLPDKKDDSMNHQRYMSVDGRGRRPSNPENMSSLSRYVRAFRNQQAWTQDTLIEKMEIEVTKQYISKVETGKIVVPTHEFLQKFSLLCGLSVQELRRMAEEK